MRASVRLGHVAGIPIGLHWSIALIAGWFVYLLTTTILPSMTPDHGTAAYLATSIGVAGAFFASIVAHELGHSLVAQRNGVRIKGITLFALGGVAQLDGEAPSPGVAARVALAGPAVSIAIGVGSVVASGLALLGGAPVLVVAGLTWLGVINLAMAAFNLLPALPLDGGRALQAFLWSRSGDRHRSTIRAASVGRVLGWVMVAFGLWQFLSGGPGLWTALIGWFVIGSAKGESLRARLELERARQAAQGTWPPPFTPFGQPWTIIDLTRPPHQAPPPDPSTRHPGPPPRTGFRYESSPGSVIEVTGRRVDPDADAR